MNYCLACVIELISIEKLSYIILCKHVFTCYVYWSEYMSHLDKIVLMDPFEWKYTSPKAFLLADLKP